MFKKPFSFDGRIRRLEFGLSFLFTFIIYSIVGFLHKIAEQIDLNGGSTPPPDIFYVILVPLFWFYFAQGAKREHDLGFSGWWQLIPFRALWHIFLKGEQSENKYGTNPKIKIVEKNINKNETSEKKTEEKSFSFIGITEIENKEKLLLKSYNNNLITETEFVEKNNKLKSDKTKLLDEQKESDIKSLALVNIKDKINDLEELMKQGLLSESEYLNKSENILKNEIELIRQKKEANIKATERKIEIPAKVYPPTKSMLEVDENVKKMEEIIKNLKTKK
jgi:uncharacterized membrane protein YhaH (DUF805 family)